VCKSKPSKASEKGTGISKKKRGKQGKEKRIARTKDGGIAVMR
jgi:hypothetical protein